MVTRLIKVIILKCIGISNHYVMYQELHSDVGQLYFENKQTHRKGAQILWLPEAGGGVMLQEGGIG